MRKTYEVEEIFRDNIVKLITNLFLKDPNLETGSSTFHSKNLYELKEDFQEKATYILEEIKRTEHLILDNGVKELQEENEEMRKDFDMINKIVYAQGVFVGSDDYFKIRETCCKHVYKK